MKNHLRLAAVALMACALAVPVSAGDKEKDIFNYVAQKEAAKKMQGMVGFEGLKGMFGGGGN